MCHTVLPDFNSSSKTVGLNYVVYVTSFFAFVHQLLWIIDIYNIYLYYSLLS